MSSKENVSILKDAIRNDPNNVSFTKQGWEPILMISPSAKIVIVGQAPGIKTQLKEEVFRDQSGERLRAWLGVSTSQFYDSGLFAVLPMDFYFPGHGKSGDLPPRSEVADVWHKRCFALMPHVELIILIGKYAQDYYLKEKGSRKVTDNVLGFEKFLPKFFPLIHPSPRNQIWMSHHPEFEKNILPVLKRHIKEILNEGSVD